MRLALWLRYGKSQTKTPFILTHVQFYTYRLLPILFWESLVYDILYRLWTFFQKHSFFCQNYVSMSPTCRIKTIEIFSNWKIMTGITTTVFPSCSTAIRPLSPLTSVLYRSYYMFRESVNAVVAGNAFLVKIWNKRKTNKCAHVAALADDIESAKMCLLTNWYHTMSVICVLRIFFF